MKDGDWGCAQFSRLLVRPRGCPGCTGGRAWQLAPAAQAARASHRQASTEDKTPERSKCVLKREHLFLLGLASM